MLLSVSRENLLIFEHVTAEDSALETIDRLKVALIDVLEGYTQNFNTTGQSAANNFMKVESIDFDNFRISDKWTQMVEIDSSTMLRTDFGTLAPVTPATTNANRKNQPL